MASTQGESLDQTGLESMIARTALKYDLLPYTSNPFPQTQPSRLAAIARLFGLKTTPLANARVLELGSAAGGNIIPHAVLYPDAQFVGVDLSRTQVAAGRSRISHLGLKNIEIHCQSFTELTEQDGKFDYIICHGVYSWVPAPVRDAILRICRQHLSPTGIAMVSYNVLPGWRMLQTLRDAFLMHVPDQLDSRQRAAQARALLDFLKTYSPDTGAYKQILTGWAERLAQLPDDYVAHEFLEEVNDPCTFRDFMLAANRHGLGFLGESDLPSMILDNQPPATAAKIREISQNQLIPTEQYLDLLNGRTFRQTLLVGEERMAEVNRNLDAARIDGLHVSTGVDLKIKRNENGAGSLVDNFGRQLNSDMPIVIDLLEALLAKFPASASVDDMVQEANAKNPAAGAGIREALFKMALVGLCTLTSEPVAAASAAPKKPVAIRLARMDAQRGELATANLRHERVGFDSLGQLVLPMMDGTADANTITEAVLKAVRAGKISFLQNGAVVNDANARDKLAVEQVKALLPSFARAGLLQADNA